MRILDEKNAGTFDHVLIFASIVREVFFALNKGGMYDKCKLFQ